MEGFEYAIHRCKWMDLADVLVSSSNMRFLVIKILLQKLFENSLNDPKFTARETCSLMYWFLNTHDMTLLYFKFHVFFAIYSGTETPQLFIH